MCAKIFVFQCVLVSLSVEMYYYAIDLYVSIYASHAFLN